MNDESRPVGRPTKYTDDTADLAFKFCLLGVTDKRLAELLGVNESTVHQWKIDHPEFSESLRRGKDLADAEIANSMYHAAKGYEHDAVHISNYQGDITVTDIVKRYPPDTKAAVMWLKNRHPDKWRDKTEQDVNVTTNLSQLMAEGKERALAARQADTPTDG
ncbi:hypothetical protein [uncultured Paraglaciecola sp.]|uniref:hypothetical protein n=1 Tax=uncultured Paraglaciecola sp. TaxID=1765024 RepID=UPI0026382368|nr:hypothetical protein [uncultured Paraglaciecola sp.]